MISKQFETTIVPNLDNDVINNQIFMKIQSASRLRTHQDTHFLRYYQNS